MKTTSILQVFELGAAHDTAATAITVRPPKTINVFRCTIFVTSQFLDIQHLPTDYAAVYVSNYDNSNINGSILLTTAANSLSQNNVIPGANVNAGNNNISSIILDRRGVGYMDDTFYIYEGSFRGITSGICFIWEGEVQ